jgi:DNA-binding response OmpR family regulator
MPDNKIILVVEDDAAMREIVAHKLQTNGFTVIQAQDGREALEKFNANHPHLILLDLMLPEVDGFTVLETIRKMTDANLAKTPVVVLSNLWSDKDILRAKDLLVQEYLVKAYFTTEEILSKVNQILNQSSNITTGA